MAAPRSFAGQLIASLVYQLAIFGGLLLGFAGTLDWPRAWAVIALDVVGTSAGLFVVRREQGLIRERFKGPVQQGQPLADRIVTFLFLAEFFAFLALLPLDVFRWHLLPPPPFALSVVGLLLIAGSFVLITLALRANPFAAIVVRHQQEREQFVVDRGPYRFVRHPMYAGDVPLLVGIALWLGSTAGVLFALVQVATLSLRIPIEERMLRASLPGYEDYARRVRWRLVPFVW